MADNYLKVRLKGSLGAGEVWTVNPSYDITSAEIPTHARLVLAAQNIADALPDLDFNVLLQLLSTAGTLDSLRVELYAGATGKLIDYAEEVLDPPIPGQFALKAPITTALCLSLRSGIPGRSGRGRLYWPAPGISLNGDTGRVPSVQLPDYVSAAIALLSGMEDAMPAEFGARLAIASTVKHVRYPVTTIDVGDVPDSARSRKDAYTELRAAGAYPTP